MSAYSVCSTVWVLLVDTGMLCVLCAAYHAWQLGVQIAMISGPIDGTLR